MTRTREPLESSGVHSPGGDRPAPEADLVDRIRRGDADAYEQLAREVAPKLYRLAVHLTGRRDEAEDLVQETLVRALPALRRFEAAAGECGRAHRGSQHRRRLGADRRGGAGLRRRARVTDAVEKFSAVKTLQAIDACQVVILMLDARDGVSEQDVHLLGMVLEAGRAVVIAANKWDGLGGGERLGRPRS